MGIISGIGLGSGLDINNIVQTLVEAEGAAKLSSIQRRESATSVRLSALSKLKSALSDFENVYSTLKKTSSFSQFSTSSSNDEVLTASVSASATKGTYQVEVSQVASRHGLISQGYSDANQSIGKGSLMLSTGGESFSVVIDDSNNSLSGLRDTINQDDNNTGVEASIIHVDNGVGGTVAKLVLRASDTGKNNELTVSATEDGASPGLANFEYDPIGSGIKNLSEQNEAKDAIIIIDGQTATRSSNTINDVIEGLTLHINQTNVGSEVQVKVDLDNDAIQEDIQDFISKYNSLMKVIEGLNKVTPENSQNGPMVGDSLLRNLTSQLRTILGEPVTSVPAEVNSLNMVGISIDRYGHMVLDESKFASLLENNLSGITSLFTKADGIVAKIDERIEPYLMSGGVLELQTQSLDSRLKSLSDEKSALDKRLEKVEERLTRQFIAMDTIVGQLQSTSAYLTQQLASF